VFLQRCSQFGYQEIKTSTIEPLHIFMATDALAPEILKKVYSFVDWSGWTGERVALRPDCTVSAARYYLAHLSDKEEARLFYMENHFLLSDTGQDVSERWQFGLEHIGDNSPVPDVEALFIALDTLRASGVERFYLHLSFPAIIAECVNRAFQEKERSTVMWWIKDGDYEKLRTSAQAQKPYLEVLLRLLQFKGTNYAYLANLKSEFPKTDDIQQHLDRFYLVCMHMDKLGYEYEINFSLSKNFEYYTGMQFEVLSVPQKRSGRDVLCAGGRYDSLIAMLSGGRHIPSVGFALYLKNILPLIHIRQDQSQRIGVVVSSITGQNISTAQQLCNVLGEFGFDCSISFTEIPQDKLSSYGLVLEADHQKYEEGYCFLYCNQLGRSLLRKLIKRGNANG
jgi:histidyl-tRNA synthetase